MDCDHVIIPNFSWIPIGSMYGIYANIGDILIVNVTIYTIHGSYGIGKLQSSLKNSTGALSTARFS